MIYHRAHVSQCARHFALVLPVALVISSLIFLSRVLAEVAASAWPASAVGRLLLFQILKYTPQLLAASLATGVLLAAARAYQQREMTAWFAAGLGARAFIAPTFAFAMPVCLAALAFTLWVSPWAVRANDALTAELRNEFDPQTAAANQFRVLPGGEYVYYWDEPAGMIFIASTGGAHGDHHATIAGGATRGNEDEGIVLREGRGYRLTNAQDESFWDEMRFSQWRLSAPPAAERTRRLSAAPAEALRWNNARERTDLARRIMLPLNALFLSLLSLFVAHSRQRMGVRQGFGVGVMLFLLNLNLMYYAVEQMERNAFSLPAGFLLPPLATLAVAFLLKARARA